MKYEWYDCRCGIRRGELDKKYSKNLSYSKAISIDSRTKKVISTHKPQRCVDTQNKQQQDIQITTGITITEEVRQSA